jgi:hypothetical protein
LAPCFHDTTGPVIDKSADKTAVVFQSFKQKMILIIIISFPIDFIGKIDWRHFAVINCLHRINGLAAAAEGKASNAQHCYKKLLHGCKI